MGYLYWVLGIISYKVGYRVDLGILIFVLLKIFVFD